MSKSSKKNNIVIFGYSGHSYVVIDALLLNKKTISGYFEKNEQTHNPYKLHYYGPETIRNLKKISSNYSVFPCVGSNSIREKMVKIFESNKLNEIIVIHPKSYVSETVEIDKSSYVGAGTIINPYVKIGKGCIINTASILEHDCLIGDYTHIAPGAVLAGNVTVGKSCFIGANAVIKNGVTIGDNAIIGAGSVVIKNVPKNEIWVGNPSKKMVKS